MNESLQTYTGLAGTGSLAAQRNRVLRNTYWLLALSMIPTVLGAWVGVSTGITAAMTPGVGLIVFLVGAYGLMFGIEKTKHSAAGVAMLLAFTFFMGLMLSRLVGVVLGFKNGTALVIMVAGIINVFVQSSAAFLTISVLCIGLFSAFMVYDLKRVIDGGETNYITATLALYLDVYNVFQSLLSLLGIFGGESD